MSQGTSALWKSVGAFPQASQAFTGIGSILAFNAVPRVTCWEEQGNNSVHTNGRVNQIFPSSWLGNTIKHPKGIAGPGCWLGRNSGSSKCVRNLFEILISQEFSHSRHEIHLHFLPLCEPAWYGFWYHLPDLLLCNWWERRKKKKIPKNLFMKCSANLPCHKRDMSQLVLTSNYVNDII